MAGTGGGPSRRSHTKSRKGCKTCKRRHIRCDETYPQCRNCTKHQVRCDYLDTPGPATLEDSSSSQSQANLLWTPEIEGKVDKWHRSNEFPFPELAVFPLPQWTLLGKLELRLVYHVAQISNDMQRDQTSRMTMWAHMMPKFLSASTSHAFVMHSILSFSANNIAWVSQSQDTRDIAMHHRQLALKGLHEAIGNFSQLNADAVLAASLLLAWQSTDWRNWASLMTGISTVVQTMQTWREQSIFGEYLKEHALDPMRNFTEPAPFRTPMDRQHEHLVTLQNVYASLIRLQPFLLGSEQEQKWIEQLKGYVEQLKTASTPQTADEQFKQLYVLRKWLYWVPVALLTSRPNDVLTLLVVAHFYAVGIAVEPLFQDVAGEFCSSMALEPLGEIARVIDQLHATQSYNQSVQSAALMMDFPKETANAYRNRRVWSRRQSSLPSPSQAHHPEDLQSLNLDLANQISEQSIYHSLSPAFTASPLHQGSPHIGSSSAGTSLSTSATQSYLEVPTHASHNVLDASSGYMLQGPAYNAHLTLPLISNDPISSSILHSQSAEQPFNYAPMASNWQSGFVPSPTVWT